MPDRVRRKRGVRTRQEIIDIAIELFAKKGYRGTGIAAVAEKAGITTAGLLHHFGSKMGLLLAVVEEHQGRDLPRYGGGFVAAPPAGVSILTRVADGLLSEPDFARLYSVLLAENLAPDDPAHVKFVDRYRGLRRSLKGWLDASKKAGRIRSGVNTAALALEMVAFMDGIQLQWLLEPDAVNLKQAYHDYVKGVSDRIKP
jgi:AcrR family transcriptional regulator